MNWYTLSDTNETNHGCWVEIMNALREETTKGKGGGGGEEERGRDGKFLIVTSISPVRPSTILSSIL